MAYFVRYLDEDIVIIVTSNSGRRGNVRDIYGKISSIIFSNNQEN